MILSFTTIDINLRLTLGEIYRRTLNNSAWLQMPTHKDCFNDIKLRLKKLLTQTIHYVNKNDPTTFRC